MIDLNVKRKEGSMRLSGQYASEFENVAETFVKNFEDRGEIGASACIHVNGELARVFSKRKRKHHRKNDAKPYRCSTRT